MSAYYQPPGNDMLHNTRSVEQIYPGPPTLIEKVPRTYVQEVHILTLSTDFRQKNTPLLHVKR